MGWGAVNVAAQEHNLFLYGGLTKPEYLQIIILAKSPQLWEQTA